MRVEYLKYFVEVARCQSINKASKNLHLTQANLSKMMATTERYFDTELFIRTNRGITLTEHGKQVLAWAQNAMNEQKKMIRAFADDNKTRPYRQGNLTILCPANIAGDSNSTVINKFTSEYPNIKLSYQEMGVPEIIHQVHESKDYVGIIMLIDDLYNELITDELCYYPMRNIKFVVYSHKDSRFAQQGFKSISLKALSKEQLIVYKPTSHSPSPFEDLFAKYGLDNIKFSVSNLFTFYDILQKGQHITLGAARQAKFFPKVLDGMITTPIRDKINCRIGILIHKENKDNPMIQQFIKFYNESK
ncbi:transcriptional regulator [Desulfitobacterium dichloroeliminans LMG P-21439]|uniref:Transcriptional regulator n=1 Tax=Desulfitobacterium dichloroeliminans (strain LMG P-21439 / DCA1) TaxID=871963 RepID=L0F8H4_DESDL|nr:LysR family transcriptional regulator [Desulfitobacterium dichloroeliminans]AGA70114.1 transcriptional regulator [Desulfitobacterium dichloroeliminans LMG P-21439]